MRRKIFEYTPFLFITPTFLCGIVYGFYSDDFVFAGIVLLVLLLGVILFSIFKKRYEIFASLIFGVLGFILMQSNKESCTLTYNKPTHYVTEMIDIPATKGRYDRSLGRVIAQKDSNIWIEVDNLVQLNIDTSNTLNIGDIIAYKSSSYAFDSIFKNYYDKQGVFGKHYVYQATKLDSYNKLNHYISAFRRATSDRILSLDTSLKSSCALMSAVTVGEKSAMDYETKNQYRNAGVSHVLAISGLHVGIIFALLSLMLNNLKSTLKGRYIKMCIEILFLWLFALFSGFSPSVLRAAIMFSFFSIGSVSFEKRNSLNILLLSAFIILSFDQMAVFDISFQLSYVAMLGIITLFKPVRSLLRPKTLIGRSVWDIFVVTTCAQLTTFPIILYYFHQISLWGFLANYITWITLPIIIISTLLFIITNINILGSIGVYVSEFQNFAIGLFSKTDIGIVEFSGMSLSTITITYIIILILICVVVYLTNRSNEIHNNTIFSRVLKQNVANHPTDHKQH